MNVTKQERRARAAPAGSRHYVLRSPKGGGGRVLRSPKGGGGRVRAFTLVEMLAVLAVMGIMFGVAVIGFNAFGRGARLRSATQMISRHLTYARQLAMTRRAQYGVEFEKDTDPQRFRVYYKDPKISNVSACPTVGKWIELPLGIEYGDNSTPPPGEMPPDEIEFKPTGRADATDLEFKIHDVDSGKERQIEVVPITGHTKTD